MELAEARPLFITGAPPRHRPGDRRSARRATARRSWSPRRRPRAIRSCRARSTAPPPRSRPPAARRWRCRPTSATRRACWRRWPRRSTRFGGIDILVNNASAISLTPTPATPMKRVDLMFGVNVRGTYLLPTSPAAGFARAWRATPCSMRRRCMREHVGWNTPTIAVRPLSMRTFAAREFRPRRIADDSLAAQPTTTTARAGASPTRSRRCSLPAWSIWRRQRPTRSPTRFVVEPTPGHDAGPRQRARSARRGRGDHHRRSDAPPDPVLRSDASNRASTPTPSRRLAIAHALPARAGGDRRRARRSARTVATPTGGLHRLVGRGLALRRLRPASAAAGRCRRSRRRSGWPRSP